MEILNLLIVILICVLIYRGVYAISKRCFLLSRIKPLKAECGARVRFLRSPFASFFRLSKKPDIAIEVGRTVYLIRLINGINGYRLLHFASKNYYVTYKKFNLYPGGRAKKGGHFGIKALTPAGTTTSSRRVHILPDMIIPQKYAGRNEYDSQSIVPVLVFNPAPCEVSYVTEERNAIKVAFTGDEFNGYKIFTASTLAIHIDRAARQEKEYTAQYF